MEKNLNPMYLMEMKARLMRKAINASLPKTRQAAGKITARAAEKGVERYMGKGLSANGNPLGRVGDLANRATATKKGQQMAQQMALKLRG